MSNNRYINREISWLAFNQRVLEEAQSRSIPLLERLKFLSITGSNLDEFISVRYAGVLRQELAKLEKQSIDGQSPRQQRITISEKIYQSVEAQQETARALFSDLAKAQIHFCNPAMDLSKTDNHWLESYMKQHILPHLSTPIAGTSVPHNQRVIAVQQAHEVQLMAVPDTLSSFIRLPAESRSKRKTLNQPTRFVLLEDALLHYMQQEYPRADYIGLQVILRDAVLDLPEEAEDILVHLSDSLKQRDVGHAMAISYKSQTMQSPPSLVVQALCHTEPMLLPCNTFLRLKDGFAFYNMAQKDYYNQWHGFIFPTHHPRLPERIHDFGGDMFGAIAAKDILVHHPYESFEVVVEFLKQAAHDPFVTDIYQTLYRTSNDSPIVHALMHAATQGKRVVVMVEVKARFDEAANLQWGKDLEAAGAHVIYNVGNYKTHAKMAMVVREYDGKKESYVHLGTGNYHSDAARIYSDVSYFTADEKICSDVAKCFHYFEHHDTENTRPTLDTLLLAPEDLRPTLLKHIKAEIEFAKSDKPATIWMKMNALVDKDIIDALYEASQAGVQITLIVRGICCLKAGVKGLSETITVKSIVGRFLEHSRIYAFGNGHNLPSPAALLFMTSADIMPRNLDRRIEFMLPITTPTVHEQLLGQIMEANVKDTLQSWEMQPDGAYIRTTSHRISTAFSAHAFFLANPSLSGRGTALRLQREHAASQAQGHKIAVIDIGSNSIRLVLYDGLKRVSLPLFNEKVMCGLARDMEQTGKLHKKGKKEALEAIERFVRITRDVQVSDVIAFATAAVRDAEDGQEFVTHIMKTFGVRVHIISGELEAKYGALGVISSLHHPRGLVCDLGGGSLELAEIAYDNEDGKVTLLNPSSMPLGVLRLKSIAEQAEKKKERMQHTATTIRDYIHTRGMSEHETLYLIGGSFRTIGKMHMEHHHYPYPIIHAYEADTAGLREVLHRIINATPKQLLNMPGMSKKRADNLAYAALCLDILLEESDARRVVFSAHGVREGVLYDRLPYPTQQQEALLQSALDMAAYLAPEPSDSWQHFSRTLFDWLTPLFRTEDSTTEYLRHVACILCRIGWHEHKANRAEIAYRWMMEVELPALSHKDRVFLAVILFFRHQTSDPKRITKSAHVLLSQEEAFRAQVIGIAMRVGLRISAGSAEALLHIQLKQKAKSLQVHVDPGARVYLNEESEQRIEKLAHIMGLKLEIR